MTSDLNNEPSDALFWVTVGDGPLLISAPHNGVELPAELRAEMSPRAAQSEDSDWFMRALYEPIARALNATLLCARYSRYVIDLNRPRTDESLYPGQRVTGLCPSETFSGAPLYPEGRPLSPQAREARAERYWAPYHEALTAHLARLKARHGQVLLWEAHSIKSLVPLLFEGRLPDFNLGTFEGRSCHVEVERALSEAWAEWPEPKPWSFVLNGRFKGGYITRAYGAPDDGVHAVQLELSQRVYLADEAQPRWDQATERRAHEARPYIQALITTCLEARARLEDIR